MSSQRRHQIRWKKCEGQGTQFVLTGSFVNHKREPGLRRIVGLTFVECTVTLHFVFMVESEYNVGTNIFHAGELETVALSNGTIHLLYMYRLL